MARTGNFRRFIMKTRLAHFIRLSLLAGLLAQAMAAFGAIAAAAAETTGLPLPRFVSLRSDEVNLRTGPGVRYPVDWVYTRRDLPVEIVAEYETWRKIRDWQGTEGWVHQSMLSGRRSVVVMGNLRPLRGEDDEQAPPLAMVEAGVVGRLEKCPKNHLFCEVEINATKGWLRRDEIWGVYSNESVE